jgi:hypothetical protein
MTNTTIMLHDLGLEMYIMLILLFDKMLKSVDKTVLGLLEM